MPADQWRPESADDRLLNFEHCRCVLKPGGGLSVLRVTTVHIACRSAPVPCIIAIPHAKGLQVAGFGLHKSLCLQ